MSAADPYAAVREFLDEHAQPLAERASDRIAASEADYGSSYLFTARRHLVAELSEELVDGAAWAALIADRLRIDETSTKTSRDRAMALLAAIAGLCVDADRLVDQLRPLITEADVP